VIIVRSAAKPRVEYSGTLAQSVDLVGHTPLFIVIAFIVRGNDIIGGSHAEGW
jgi:hypothetical protein